MRGEKQAGQRAASPVSRQAVAAERGHHGVSRSQTPPSSCAGALDLGRIDPGVLGEGDQQRLVAGKMVEHAGEEARGRGRPCGSGRGRCRWRRETGRDARAPTPGTTAPRRRAPRRPRAAPGPCCCGFCRSSWLPILDAAASLAIFAGLDRSFRKFRGLRAVFNRCVTLPAGPCGAARHQQILSVCHGVNACGRRRRHMGSCLRFRNTSSLAF